MAKCVNLEVFKKTTKSYELRFTENGQPKNIAGWTIYFTVKEKITDTDANAKINHDVTDHLDETNGKTLISLTKDDTNRIGNYYYDMTYKDSEDNVGVLYYGRIKFTEKATQRA